MKFRSKSADLIVWNPQKGKELCRFKDHQYETEDPYIIDRLGDYEVVDSELLDASTYDEQKHFIEGIDKEQQVEDLRKEAKEIGIKGWNNMKPENLKKKLRGD